MSNTIYSSEGAGNTAPNPNFSGVNTKVKTALYVIFRIFLPLSVLIIGAVVSFHLLQTGPQARTMQKKKSATVVKTIPAKFGTYETEIHAMGVVKAAQSVALKPQVSGQVISISDHLLPGGKFTKGDTLLKIDPRDYELSVKQQESAVFQAKSNLDLEEGNQIVARRELALLGEQVTAEEERLMLRKPQLNSLQVALEIAEAQYEQALLNLERTEVKAPFNGIVQTRDVNIGTWVSTSSSLATLIGSDSYWVEVSVPEDQLKWISFPGDSSEIGSSVKIFNPTAWEGQKFRMGRVIQLIPSLETQGRMARLLVEIQDPLAIESENKEKPKALIGSFVRVTIEGNPVSRAIELPREYLREGKNVWVLSEDGQLDIREVSIAFKNTTSVLITAGIEPGENVIVTSLSAPVEGMALLQSGSNQEKPGSGKKGMGKLANKTKSGQEVQQ